MMSFFSKSSSKTPSVETAPAQVEAKKEPVTDSTEPKKETLMKDVKEIHDLCVQVGTCLEQKKIEFENMLKEIEKLQTKVSPSGQVEIADFNVGGSRFAILKSNITKKIRNPKSAGEEFYEPNLLEALVNNTEPVIFDSAGAIFIDRNPRYFGYILDYLRQANTESPFKLPKNSNDPDFVDGLFDEAEFYKVPGLKSLLTGKNIPSNILTSVEVVEKFVKLLAPVKSLIDPSRPWKLLYRATEHGFDAASFHKRCDDFPNTIVVCKVAETNHVFGGFTSIGWKSSGGYRLDAKAFIFSLVNKANEPELMMCSSPTNAVLHAAESGPVFGGGHDIYITNKSNTSNLSYSRVGTSYKSEKYRPGSYEAQYYLAGLTNFLLTEMEVFQQAE